MLLVFSGPNSLVAQPPQECFIGKILKIQAPGRERDGKAGVREYSG